MTIQHFILTRFNLVLWPHDKLGNENGTTEWLEHRCTIFAQYCLASVAAQTSKDFEWILLVNDETPEEYREKIESYKAICPQINVVYVKHEHNRRFAEVFRQAVQKRVSADRVVTTYLDNDDCLGKTFIADVQSRFKDLPDKTFLYYREGYQFFTEFGLMLKIRYPRNHFPSVIESRDSIRTIYGYGSHYYIDRMPDVRLEMVEGVPMWCEVIHERNESNDAYFLSGIKQVRDKNLMQNLFSVDVEPDTHYTEIFVLHFVPRYIKTFARRVRGKLFGMKWLRY